MLVLSRTTDQAIEIDGGIIVRVLKVAGQQVRLGIEAPAAIQVDREEVAERKRQEKRQREGGPRAA